MKSTTRAGNKRKVAKHDVQECIDELQKPENSKFLRTLLLELADTTPEAVRKLQAAYEEVRGERSAATVDFSDIVNNINGLLDPGFYQRVKPAPDRQDVLARVDYNTILRKIEYIAGTATEKRSSLGTKKAALLAMLEIAETICRGGYVIDGQSPVWGFFDKNKSDVLLSMSHIISTMSDKERMQMRGLQMDRTALDDLVESSHKQNTTNHSQLTFSNKIINLYKADNGSHEIFKGQKDIIIQLEGEDRWHEVRKQQAKELDERRKQEEKSKRMAKAMQQKAREELRKRKREEMEADDGTPKKRFLCF